MTKDRSLQNYYLITYLLVNKHKWDIRAVEDLPPFERDLYVDFITNEDNK